MTITAKIIERSRSAYPLPLTTIQLRYPKFIHGELMTHRVFSRNASSSRAIPVKRLIEDIRRDPVMPMHWGKNQPGMQAHEELDVPVEITFLLRETEALLYDGPRTREQAWEWARERAIEAAEAFDRAGYHKQIVNRLIEPFSHINTLVTSVHWKNFFKLRKHKDAMPEMKYLAEEMYDEFGLYRDTPAKFVQVGEFGHLPYVTEAEREEYAFKTLMKVSTARCARVSYLTHEMKEPDINKDIELHDKLMVQEPLHASPAEHVCAADYRKWAYPHLHGNTPGWIQYRKTFANEFEEG